MFLPVLLIRDYGYASFFIFAVPNVVGAMMMGVFLQRPGASALLVQRHAAACVSFSWVTIAYQIFFLFWAMPRGPAYVPLLAAFAATALACVVIRGRWSAVLSVVLLLVSVGMGIWWGSQQRLGFFVDAPGMMPESAAGLLLVCSFGFGLCPYLDLTFHRARQMLPGTPGSIAFVIGFGVFFLAMIVLTLLYAGPLMAAGGLGSRHVFPSLLAAPLLIHLGAQLAFTFMLHRGETHQRLPRHLDAFGVVIAGVLAVGLGLLAHYRPALHRGMLTEELIYRLFLSFYGLIFPAYVWLCIITRGPLSRHNLAVFAAACAAASPMFWMGFIERRTWWLIPGVLLVLAARLLTRRNEGPEPAAVVTAPRDPSPSLMAAASSGLDPA